MLYRKFSVLIVVCMVFAVGMIVPPVVSAVESNTIEIDLYPTADKMVNEYPYSVESITVPATTSTYVWFRPIYVNDTGTRITSISLESHLATPEGSSGRLSMCIRNDATSNISDIGGYYTSTTSTLYVLDSRVSIYDIYTSLESPNYFSFGFNLTNTYSASRTYTLRFYHVTAHITYERTDSSVTILNAIAGLNASMQTRFNAVDYAVSGIQSDISYANNSINNMVSDISYLNNTVNNIDTAISSMQSDIDYMNGTINTIDAKIDNVLTNVSTVINNLASVSGDISTINNTVNSIDSKCTGINSNITALASNITDYSANFTAIMDAIDVVNDTVVTRSFSLASTMSTLYNTLSHQISLVEGKVNFTLQNASDTFDLLDMSVDDIMDEFDDIDSQIASLYSVVTDGFNVTFDEFDLTRYYINSTFENITADISNQTTVLLDTVFEYISDASNNTIDNITANVTHLFGLIIENIGNVTFDYSLITNAINETEGILFDAVTEYYIGTLSQVNDSFDNMLSEINVVYDATLNLTTMTLDGFNGTSEEFDYTWQLINNTYDLVELAYDEFIVVEDMIYNSSEMVEYILTSSLEYRNDIIANLTDCCYTIGAYYDDVTYRLDNYHVLIQNVEVGVYDILFALNQSKYTADDGLVYVLKSADTDVSVKYEYVKERWTSSEAYYRYSILSNDGSKLTKAIIEVDYEGKDLDGFWRDVVISGVDGDIVRVIPLSNYYFSDGNLYIDTLSEQYDSFVIHVSPTIVTRIVLYWDNFMNR